MSTYLFLYTYLFAQNMLLICLQNNNILYIFLFCLQVLKFQLPTRAFSRYLVLSNLFNSNSQTLDYTPSTQNVIFNTEAVHNEILTDLRLLKRSTNFNNKQNNENFECMEEELNKSQILEQISCLDERIFDKETSRKVTDFALELRTR